MKRVVLLLLWLTACSASLNALDPAVDAGRLDARLADTHLDAPTYVQTVWLCLLHGRACERVAREPEQVPPSLESLLARALASDGLLAIGPRLDAWLALADAASAGLTGNQPGADALLSLAVESAARLALRDEALLRARLATRETDVTRWLSQGAPAERWRRLRALAPWHGAQPTAVPLDLALAPHPVSRRLFTGLDALATTPPPFLDALPLPAPPHTADPWLLPARDPGVYRLQATFSLTEATLLLVQLQSPRPLRLWCDGQMLAPFDPRDAAGREDVWLDLPAGAHRLDLAVPIGQNGQPLGLALLPGTRAASAVGPRPWHETLDTVVTALREPDSAAAARLAEQFPHALLAADAALARADLRDSESLPPVAAVDALLAQWPAHTDARLARATHTREAGQPQLAWQSLQALEPPSPAVDVARDIGRRQRADVLLESALTYQALGLPDLAAAAAEAAAVQQPTDCKTLTHALTIGQDTLNRPLIRRLLERPRNCPQDLPAVAFAEAMAGRLDDALATFLAAQADPVHARMASGFAREIARSLQKPLPPRPVWGDDRQADMWHDVQAAAQRRDSAATQKALHALLTAPGLPLEARQKAMQAGATPLWLPFVQDGEVVAQTEVTDAFADGSATVWLLDQEIVQLLPDGGALRRVHQVVRVREDAAADAVGEIRVGEGADLELARTILPDGSLVLPAETDDKETISLRAVAVGTAVEFAQIAYQPPDDPATGATRLPLFHMQSTDAPVVRSEYIVLVPQGLQVHLDASVAAGVAEIKQVGAFTAHIYRRTNLPRVRNEPRSARPERVLPTVRALVRAGLASVVEPWNEALAAYVQSRDPTLRTWRATAAQVPESLRRWQKLASRLALTVQNAHEGGPPGRPETALTEGKGDRAVTFYTLARQLGADACLVRVLPLARLPAPDPLVPDAALDPADYGLELVRLRVPLPGAATLTDVWYDPAQEGGRLDHVRAGLRGRQGLLCGCTVPPADPRVTVPPLGEGRDQRVIDVTLEWAEDGQLTGVVHEQLHGAVASTVRAFLRGNGGDDDELVRQLADGAFTGAGLQLLHIEGLAGEGDIALAYEVTLAADRARADALDLELWAEQLGQAYAQLPNRTTPLLFSHALDLAVTVTVQNQGEPVHELPLDVAVDLPTVRYSRQVRRAGDALVVTRKLWSQPAVIAPAQYVAFAQALRTIDAGDRVRLRRSP